MRLECPVSNAAVHLISLEAVIQIYILLKPLLCVSSNAMMANGPDPARSLIYSGPRQVSGLF
jgi:hypothetical protein